MYKLGEARDARYIPAGTRDILLPRTSLQPGTHRPSNRQSKQDLFAHLLAFRGPVRVRCDLTTLIQFLTLFLCLPARPLVCLFHLCALRRCVSHREVVIVWEDATTTITTTDIFPFSLDAWFYDSCRTRTS